MAQLEKWMTVSRLRQTFVKGSPELESLEELYEHIMSEIAESKHLKMGDTEERDLQEFEITHKDSSFREEPACDDPGLIVGITKLIGGGM